MTLKAGLPLEPAGCPSRAFIRQGWSLIFYVRWAFLWVLCESSATFAVKSSSPDKKQNISMEALLLHHAALRNPNIVAGGVLHFIHHSISLADDVVRGLSIVRISGKPNRRADVQVESFLFAEAAGTHTVTQAAGHHFRGIFAGLRQQDHKFVSAVPERKINKPQLCFDQISNFRQ